MNIHFTEASKKTSNKPSNYSLLAAAVAVIISIFFTYDLYSSSLQKSDELETLKVNEVTITETLNALNTLSASANASKDSQKYIWVARDDLILESIFSLSGTGVEIWSVALDSGELLTSGMTLAGINLTVDTTNLDTLLKFIDRATGVDAKRRFLIKSLNFAYESAATTTPITATIQLWAYTIK